MPPSRRFRPYEEDGVVEVKVEFKGFLLLYSYRAILYPLKALVLNTYLCGIMGYPEGTPLGESHPLR